MVIAAQIIETVLVRHHSLKWSHNWFFFRIMKPPYAMSLDNILKPNTFKRIAINIWKSFNATSVFLVLSFFNLPVPSMWAIENEKKRRICFNNCLIFPVIVFTCFYTNKATSNFTEYPQCDRNMILRCLKCSSPMID